MLDREQMENWWFENIDDPPEEPAEALTYTQLEDVKDITQGPKKPQLHPEY